jgi:hypothetical protein
MLLLVAACAGGIYLADRIVPAPGRALQQQLAARDAEIRALMERNQALEAAVRLLRHTERRARLVVRRLISVRVSTSMEYPPWKMRSSGDRLVKC